MQALRIQETCRMTGPRRDVWITGIGLVSSLGEGRDAHWAAMSDPARQPVVDETGHAPFPLHPLAPIELDRQIPKKGDQRQMEPWQRLGTYGAGLAIDDAGARGLVPDMHLVVAAGGGERDFALDEQILAELAALPPEEAAPRLNEMLAKGLRPTLFLAQLSNLLAGNISIVHGVTGSSRTFMGEEQAGADALRIAQARLAEGRGDIALAGGAYLATRWDMLLLFRCADVLWDRAWESVWARAAAGGGMVTGSLAAFIVMETAEHARARGTRGLARIDGIASEASRRTEGDSSLHAIRRAWSRLASMARPGPLPVLSGATGLATAAREERSFLAGLSELGIEAIPRATGSRLGHGLEATFAANAALGALALSRGSFFPPFEAAAEPPAPGAAPDQLLVTSFGQWRGESLALLSAIPDSEQPA
jgi:3-oxoacyl-[acyl-carrier-protein] synthase II